MSEPLSDLRATVRNDGAAAFRSGIPASRCPYAFCVSVYWAVKDYAAFDRDYRPLLNEWMRGWIDAKALNARQQAKALTGADSGKAG